MNYVAVREIGRVKKSHLGWEDHGIFTAYVDLDFGGSHQSTPPMFLASDSAGGYDSAGWFIKNFMKACKVHEWNSLPGILLEVERDRPHGLIRRIRRVDVGEVEWYVLSDMHKADDDG